MPKQPIALLITDTHLTPNNIPLVTSIFQQYIDLAKKLNIKYLVHCGDFFNSRSSQGLECLLAGFDIFHMFEQNDLVLNIIAGNHDKQSLLEPISYVSVFKKMHNIKVYEKPFFEYDVNLKIVYCYLSYFKEGVCYLNYLVDLIEMVKADKKIVNYKRVLFTHISANGVKNNDGSLVDGDVETEYFEFFDVVHIGHYHDFQKLNNKITYIGSAYQANYGETEEKGFTILYNDLSIKQIKSKFPIYKKLYIDAKDKEQAGILLEQNANTTDNIRFIFQGEKIDLENINPQKYNEKNIEIKWENVDNKRDFEDVEEATMVKFSKSSIIKFWGEYAEKNNLTKEQKSKGIKLLMTSK